MIELTERQREALSAGGEQPPTFIDPQTNAAYILLPRHVYDRRTAGSPPGLGVR